MPERLGADRFADPPLLAVESARDVLAGLPCQGNDEERPADLV